MVTQMCKVELEIHYTQMKSVILLSFGVMMLMVTCLYKINLLGGM